MAATPAQLGYRMPAEWERHAATWFTWPRPEGISFPGAYETIPPVYAELFRQLTRVEEVHLNVWDKETEQRVREFLGSEKVPLERMFFHPFPSYEPWCRDHGPIFLARDSAGRRADRSSADRAIVDWGYNAWGGKYPPCDLDDAVPQHVAKFRGLPLYSPNMVLEGGSIEVNGRGTLLTTESCLLNPNRNPTLSKSQIEIFLKDYLGVVNILWLGDGIMGDDTDGHIDDLTRFVGPSKIVTMIEDDETDENHEPLQANLHRLQGMRDEAGRPLEILTLPMPGRIDRGDLRLPASYANFYIANEIVLVPTFRDPNDRKALEVLQAAFPDRRVTGVDSTDLIWGLGSFHCISQQEPA